MAAVSQLKYLKCYKTFHRVQLFQCIKINKTLTDSLLFYSKIHTLERQCLSYEVIKTFFYQDPMNPDQHLDPTKSYCVSMAFSDNLVPVGYPHSYRFQYGEWKCT